MPRFQQCWGGRMNVTGLPAGTTVSHLLRTHQSGLQHTPDSAHTHSGRRDVPPLYSWASAWFHSPIFPQESPPFYGQESTTAGLLGWTQCDPDDSIFSLNGIHEKLSRKYLDQFPEDRSNEGVSMLPTGTGFSPGKDSMGRTLRKATFTALF